MKKHLNIWLWLIALVSIFAGCKKDQNSEVQLPPATQTGANTFGCLLNGKIYIPNGGGIASQSLSVLYDPTFQGGKLSIKTFMTNPEAINIIINADSINSTGIFPIIQAGKYWVYYDDLNNNSCFFETITMAPVSGQLTISKFDVVNKIVSGSFSFKVSTASCGIVEATDGRFDVKY